MEELRIFRMVKGPALHPNPASIAMSDAGSGLHHSRSSARQPVPRDGAWTAKLDDPLRRPPRFIILQSRKGPITIGRHDPGR